MSAASRLHGSSWDEQLAGARALAKLADQWYSEGANAQAQHCIDVLCSYLRVRKYAPRPGSDQAESAIREQITLLLMDFLRSGLGGVRGGILLNLAAVRLQGHHVFHGASFGPGLRLILDRAHLEEGSRLSFDNCRFQGCIVRLLGVSLEKHAVLRLARSRVDAGAWLLASTANVHPSARVDVRGITARAHQGARAYFLTGTHGTRLSSAAGTH